MSERFYDSNFSLLKGLHHVKIAMEYFNDVSNSCEYGSKQIMKNYANKCSFIIDNVRHRLPQDMLSQLDEDMSDSLFFDAIEDKVIHFTESQKQTLEVIVDMMTRGELIEITDKK
jgi:hypothetical protein